MRILSPGRVNEYIIECPKCECKFAAFSEDFTKTADGSAVQVCCPQEGCGTRLNISIDKLSLFDENQRSRLIREQWKCATETSLLPEL